MHTINSSSGLHTKQSKNKYTNTTHCCVCLQPGLGFPTSYVVVFVCVE